MPSRQQGRLTRLALACSGIAALLFIVSGFCMPAMANEPLEDVTAFADVTGDGIPDVASFADNGTGRPGIAIHSGATGGLHAIFDYLNDSWLGLTLASPRDGNQHGVADDPAASVLAVNTTTGKIRVETRRLDTGDLLSSILVFNENWRAVDVVIVDDLNGDGIRSDSAVAVLAERWSGGAIESHGQGHVKDVDGDGDMDMVLHFITAETGIACGDAEATLTGETFGGEPLMGSDPINTVNCQ